MDRPYSPHIKQIDKLVSLEKQRIIRAFSDVNFNENPINSKQQVELELGLEPDMAITLIHDAIPNGLNTFYPSDLERLIETFKQPIIYIGRDNGVIIKIEGEPAVDPSIIKRIIGANNVTIESENSFIFSWN